MNLVVNARDAMPRGGVLEIETSNVKLDAGFLQAHSGRGFDISEPATYVRLAVSDAGVGMDQETIGRIFDPFFTTKERGKGTGLGLSTCYGIVKQSGGHIGVYSEPGFGTSFRVYLPRVGAAGLAYPPEAPEGMPRGTETILLVEDEDGVRELASEVLAGLGYRLVTASDGEEALETLRRNGERPIDLVITDVIMPRVGGR